MLMSDNLVSKEALMEDTEKFPWKKNLPVLWVGVFLCCASYTSCIPLFTGLFIA